MNFWLMKSEPAAYSFEDLRGEPNKTTLWDGVRNYQARNFMRDDFRRGDQAFFYHSNCTTPSIVGVIKIVSDAYPDPTQFDPESKYFDLKSTADNPRWVVVDVKYVRALKRSIPLGELKVAPALKKVPLVQPGNRLSIMPISAAEWDYIVSLET